MSDVSVWVDDRQVDSDGPRHDVARTSERPDSTVPHVRAISDRDGRILVVMTHNTDFGDAFEREGFSREHFEEFAGKGYAFGINTLLSSMTH